MNENKFYEILRDFLQKNKISLPSNFESIKKEWIPFFHTHSSTLHHCICSHKVKNITYLFNISSKTILFIGTSCCKKYGLLEKHMENDILIHILKTQIVECCYEMDENRIVLKNDLIILLESYIFEKFKHYTEKYVSIIDPNTYYFDVFKPLNKMREDILELIETYGYDLQKYYDEINEFLKERDIYMNEQVEIETNSEMIETLNFIENEISQLLDETINQMDEPSVVEEPTIEEPSVEEPIIQLFVGNSELFQGDKNLYFQNGISLHVLNEKYQQNDSSEKIIQENHLVDDFEKELEINSKIEEEIKQEINEEKELQEREAYYYLQNDNIKNYWKEEYNDIHYKNYDYKCNIEKLQNQIEHLKKDVSRFTENVQLQRKNVNDFILVMDICNSYSKKI